MPSAEPAGVAAGAAEPQKGGVQSVERAFDLLEAIVDARGEVSLSELAEAVELPLPTIHRLLRTLTARGYVRQQPSRRYALGVGLIRLGSRAGEQVGILARDELRRLVLELGETANLAILDGDSAVYVAQSPSPHSMRMFTEVGRRVPLYNTGVGKAMLAALPDPVARELIARATIEQRTAKGHATAAELLADLTRIRERGFAIDDEEQELGVRCYAITVPGIGVPTAISVSGPTGRVDEAFGEHAVPVLRAAAERIAAELPRAAG
ncbi:IclR family transcriptional regulator [Naumannella sp. ID2617S]|nr:IclR family transcriptional regulator [Naumannella sp. ID2617S]